MDLDSKPTTLQFMIGFPAYYSNSIPLNICKPVKFIMKDSDGQQQNEIVKALKEVFPSAVEGACGWNIGEKIDSSFHLCNAIPIFIQEVSYFYLQLLKVGRSMCPM